MKKKAVVIGGGNGAAISINALKPFINKLDIDAVISMSDSGGSSGVLKKEFDTLPMGDIMRATLAMSPYDFHMLKKIFYRNRFQDVGKLSNHNLGNLFLALGKNYSGSFLDGIRALHNAVEAVGTAHPVTLEQSDLCAELTNGEVIVGEHEIDKPSYDRSQKIVRAWLEPAPPIYNKAKEVIEQANYIFIGPGSLFTSVIATLCADGVKEAIQNSKATLIYIVANAIEKDGETGPEKVSERIAALEQYLPRKVDIIIRNNHVLTPEEKKKYDEKNWGMIDFDEVAQQDGRIINGDFERGGFGLDSAKLSTIVKGVLWK